MSDLIGHASVLDLLRKMLKSGRIGSGLILVGPEGVGKMEIGKWIVQKLHGVQGMDPDVMILQRERNEKGDFKKNITIEQVRDLTARLSLSSFGGGAKIGIIDAAQTLSTDAADALLKTLEDPAGNILVILLTTNTQALPATVLSRCQTLHVPRVSREEICDALVAKGAGREHAHEISTLAEGRPEFALRLFQNAELHKHVLGYRRDLQTFLQSGTALRFGMIQRFLKESKEEMDLRLDAWESFLHEMGDIAFAARLVEARRAIRQNVNPSLALEHSFI